MLLKSGRLYYEYNNSGDGSDTSDREYETAATAAITIDTVLGSDYASWATNTGNGYNTTSSSSSSASSGSTTISASNATTVVSDATACTPTAGGDASTDDTPAIASAIASCGSGGTIVIPAGTTYYLNTVLEFTGCEGCTVNIEGTLQASDDLDYWEGKTAIIYLEDIAGATVQSTTGAGVIDGNGQAAYDRFASDSSYARPTLFYVSGGSDIVVTGLTTINPPNVYYSVNGGATNVAFSGLTMTSESTSDNPAKNTDGFDIGSSTYTTLSNITVSNQDDCVAFKAGANYVTVTDISCTGSHGLSVGSLGSSSDDTVQNIWVEGATMISSAKAVGIKTYPSGDDHGTSTVTNVTYKSITVQDCTYAIQIQSCYNEDADYCADNPGNAVLTGITFEGFSGTTTGEATSNLDCGADGTCDISISDYDVTGSDGSTEVLCANTPSDLGVECTDGASG